MMFFYNANVRLGRHHIYFRNYYICKIFIFYIICVVIFCAFGPYVWSRSFAHLRIALIARPMQELMLYFYIINAFYKIYNFDFRRRLLLYAIARCKCCIRFFRIWYGRSPAIWSTGMSELMLDRFCMYAGFNSNSIFVIDLWYRNCFRPSYKCISFNIIICF